MQVIKSNNFNHWQFLNHMIVMWGQLVSITKTDRRARH